MLNYIASIPYHPMNGINLTSYELSGLWIAIASLCVLVCAITRTLKKKTIKSEPS